MCNSRLDAQSGYWHATSRFWECVMQSRDCASYVECIIIAHHIRKCLVSRIWCSLRVWYQYWPGWLTWRQLSPILIFVGYHLCERESQCRVRERSTTSLLCDNVGSRTGTWSSPTKMWLWYSLTQPMHQLSSAYSFCICSTVNNQILKGGGVQRLMLACFLLMQGL